MRRAFLRYGVAPTAGLALLGALSSSSTTNAEPAPFTGGFSAGPQPGETKKERRTRRTGELRKWSMAAHADVLNKADPTVVEEYRHVVAVVGITGSGKSSTANTMMARSKMKKSFSDALMEARLKSHQYSGTVGSTAGAAGGGAGGTSTDMGDGRPQRNRKFEAADCLTSVTHSVSYRDYTFRGVPFRIIDTPGLFDTNRPTHELQEELEQMYGLSQARRPALLPRAPHAPPPHTRRQCT